ncbi:ferredoxin [Williamsia sp.]|uniref:ferredoxin n=1 Tax=Williamsia sp. TaxID=1872085 RepID=UPI001A2ACB61|nr:ferredoxin [Williamsia sp.]MBJ7287789.1 ferredoxin [Williamsia sp.]
MSAQSVDPTDQTGQERWSVRVGEHCIGSGMCVALDPEHFSLENGRARTEGAQVTPDQRYIDAADTCPAAAITVTDADGTELAPT